ncbi:hypothetical protein ACP4OV_022703 [Aristida adscensionis]
MAATWWLCCPFFPKKKKKEQSKRRRTRRRIRRLRWVWEGDVEEQLEAVEMLFAEGELALANTQAIMASERFPGSLAAQRAVAAIVVHLADADRRQRSDRYCLLGAPAAILLLAAFDTDAKRRELRHLLNPRYLVLGGFFTNDRRFIAHLLI